MVSETIVHARLKPSRDEQLKSALEYPDVVGIRLAPLRIPGTAGRVAAQRCDPQRHRPGLLSEKDQKTFGSGLGSGSAVAFPGGPASVADMTMQPKLWHSWRRAPCRSGRNCSDIPHAKGSPGYFRGVIDAKRVSGALVTTQSEHDTAVCKAYPAACFVRGDVAFAPGEFPKYGALGAFGVRGPGVEAVDLKMLESLGISEHG